jgi:hypothetical protein
VGSTSDLSLRAQPQSSRSGRWKSVIREKGDEGYRTSTSDPRCSDVGGVQFVHPSMSPASMRRERLLQRCRQPPVQSVPSIRLTTPARLAQCYALGGSIRFWLSNCQFFARFRLLLVK